MQTQFNSHHPVRILTLALAGLMIVGLAACTKTPEPVAPVESAPVTVAPVTTEPAAATTVGADVDDSMITTKVMAALLADPDVKSLDIQTETRKGEVQLSGFVANTTQIDRAIAVARAVEGVTSVSNKMSVKQ